MKHASYWRRREIYKLSTLRSLIASFHKHHIEDNLRMFLLPTTRTMISYSLYILRIFFSEQRTLFTFNLFFLSKLTTKECSYYYTAQIKPKYPSENLLKLSSYSLRFDFYSSKKLFILTTSILTKCSLHWLDISIITWKYL